MQRIELLDQLSYLKVSHTTDKNGDRILQSDTFTINLAQHSLSNSTIEYIIIASDLQGFVKDSGKSILLGEYLAEYLDLLFSVQFGEISRSKIAVFLCGDLYARMDKRGGQGDVRHVWQLFKNYFGIVVGVGGNHDTFGNEDEFRAFRTQEGVYFLDADSVDLCGMRIAGLSGIMGREDKPFRTEENKYIKKLKSQISRNPDFILLHEGPSHSELDLAGNQKIEEEIRSNYDGIVCCGHNHWKNYTIVSLDNATIINVDAKCVILKINQNI